MANRRVAPDPELLGLLVRSGDNVRRTAGLMQDMLRDYPEHSGLAREIFECEQAGDRIAHDILARVACQDGPGPLESPDVHALVSALDDIVDYAEEAADRLVLYRVEAPMEQAEGLAAVLVAASEQVGHALGALRADADVSASLVEIHRLENEGDRLLRAATASLFEDGIDPMVVIRWKDIFESLEQAVDACETVAHVLEGIGLKRGRR